MGIFGALSTAVSGLRAQSQALESISGNIANSQTTAYKRVETSFVDLIPDAPVKSQIPGSVLAQSRSTISDQGDVVSSTTNTFMAINGSGFFAVDSPNAAGEYFSRRGDFEVDKDGYLVNGAGYYLKGHVRDMETGEMSSTIDRIQISTKSAPASLSKVINYKLNLPTTPKNPDSEDGGDGMLTLAAGNISRDDNEQFLRQSISGGEITLYTENGTPVSMQMRWAKTDAAPDEWKAFYLSDNAATGTQDMWTEAATFEFNGDGSLSSTNTMVNLTDLTFGSAANGNELKIGGDVQLVFGAGGLTQQYAGTSGTASVVTLNQDGYPSGTYESVAVDDGGRIFASYSNGQQIEVAKVVLANFNAPEQLKRMDGGVYTATSSSGTATYSTDGPIFGAALESSNTDISEEFTKLIITQQAYSAGTRIVSASNDMMQEALNMIR